MSTNHIIPAAGSPSEGITAPDGVKKRRGRPRKTDSLAILAASWNISVRNLQRALFVRRHGIPALVEMGERSELSCSELEYIARWPQAEQRDCCARGAAYLRKLLPLVRRAEAEEKAKSPRLRKVARPRSPDHCPHCGGEL
jgi:hypothetical protein